MKKNDMYLEKWTKLFDTKNKYFVNLFIENFLSRY